MDVLLVDQTPPIQVAALSSEIGRLALQHRADPPALRAAVVGLLKSTLRQIHADARERLLATGNGPQCAASLSAAMDDIIKLAYGYILDHVYPLGNPSTGEQMTIAATGGYGRGMLAPKSDIDLLFLLPYKQTPWGESVVEAVLYLLWDLGLKVGHAVRSVEQSIHTAADDMTVRTALLDTRHILGSEQLFAELNERLATSLPAETCRAFIAAKYAEREERHKRAGHSRYKVEPNIKDGKGGLRDLHLMHWVGRYLSLTGHPAGAGDVSLPLLLPPERETFRRAEDFLWTTRCHLHFITGRAEERLTFEVQPLVAEALQYRGSARQRPVERFMRHYFLTAKSVGDLTRTFSSALELRQLKAEPRPIGAPAEVTWQTRMLLRRRTDFRIENGRINAAMPEVFRNNPVNLIRIFSLSNEFGVEFHPDAMRMTRQSLRLIDERLRGDSEANRIFLDMLTAKTNVEIGLRRMNEAGVLGRFMPEFGRIVALMQFSAYHHYTVDEHTIRAVGILAAIEQGKLVEDHPLASSIIAGIELRRALYVAVLLHDIGKGRKEDHSILGARIARSLCPRLGLSPLECETVAWLVEHHLVMSTFAQSRDLTDPQTIRDFAAIVQSPERLRLLLILTVVDIRAVGPGVWNGWKGQLLRTLYWETEPILAGGHTGAADRDGRIDDAKERLAAALLPEMPGEAIERIIARHPPSYWLRTDIKRQIEHARLMQRAERSQKTVVCEATTDAFTAVTELTVLAPDHARLLSLFAGACASAGANIMGAQVSTTLDGAALDTFLLKREFDEEGELRRAARIGATIEKLVSGKLTVDRLPKPRVLRKESHKAFTVEAEVVVNNRLSSELTVLEVSGLDRTGLLFDLTSAISDLGLDIVSAHITTYGERVVDVFYVTDLVTRRQVTDEARQAAIAQRLRAAMVGG